MKLNTFLLLLLLSAQSYTSIAQDKGTLVDEIVAIIGDEIVLKSDIDLRIADMKAQGYPVNEKAKGILLEEILYQKLLINQAKVDSLEVSEDEVNSQLERKMDYFISQFANLAEFESFYGKSVSQLKEEFRQDVRDQMLTQKMQAEITRNMRVTPSDVEDFHASLPKDSLPLVESEVQYSQIVFQPKISKAQIDQTKESLNTYRDELIENPYKFGLYATLYSKDPGSANSQNLGCYRKVEKGVMVPEFEQEVLNLQPGQISEPFKTNFGYHIARLESKSGKYYDVCHILLDIIPLEENIQQAQFNLDTLKQSIETNDSLTFRLAATKYSQDKDTRAAGGQVPNQYTGGTKHEVSKLDPQITLVLNQLKEGEISDPVLFTTQTGLPEYRLFFLQKRFDAHVATINTDYSLLKRMTESEAQNKALEMWIEKKLSSTYCRLNDEYSDFNFRYNWNLNQ